MAARRLILVMLVLLVLSSIAAALIPVDRDRLLDQSSTGSTMEAAPTEPPRGELLIRTVPAEAPNPAEVRIGVGDQLQLTVTSKRPDTVEIAAFGVHENVDPDDPATFDLLASRPGRFPVRLVERPRQVATIIVEAGGKRRSAKGSQ